jgi:hypothetical protein
MNTDKIYPNSLRMPFLYTPCVKDKVRYLSQSKRLIKRLRLKHFPNAKNAA